MGSRFKPFMKGADSYTAAPWDCICSSSVFDFVP